MLVRTERLFRKQDRVSSNLIGGSKIMNAGYNARCLFCQANELERDAAGRIIALADEVRATLLCSIPEHRAFAVESIGTVFTSV